MIESNVYFFGSPSGFQVYPKTGNSGFYDKFYINDENKWRLLIRQNQNIVRYVYIRYGLYSKVGRGESMFGFSFELKDNYITCINKLLNFFHDLYKTIIDDKEIIQQTKYKTIFLIDSFENKNQYVDNWIKVLKSLPDKLKEDIRPLKSNLENTTTKKVEQFGVNTKDEIINSAFLRNRSVNILPVEIPVVEERQPEVIEKVKKEPDIRDLIFEQPPKPDNTKTEIKYLKAEIENLKTLNKRRKSHKWTLLLVFAVMVLLIFSTDAFKISNVDEDVQKITTSTDLNGVKEKTHKTEEELQKQEFDLLMSITHDFIQINYLSAPIELLEMKKITLNLFENPIQSKIDELRKRKKEYDENRSAYMKKYGIDPKKYKKDYGLK